MPKRIELNNKHMAGAIDSLILGTLRTFFETSSACGRARPAHLGPPTAQGRLSLCRALLDLRWMTPWARSGLPFDRGVTLPSDVMIHDNDQTLPERQSSQAPHSVPDDCSGAEGDPGSGN
jgi:hypothetical protein